MLDDQLQTQLQQTLGLLRQPIHLQASLGNDAQSDDMRQLLQTLAACSPLIQVTDDGQDVRRPSFVVTKSGENRGVRFAGLPLGHEFTSLVLALLWTGGHPPKVDADTLEAIRALNQDMAFEVFMSLSCHNCPDVVQAVTLMAVINPRIQAVIIEGGAFQQEVSDRQILAVPMVFLNGQSFGSGRMSVDDILARLDVGADQRNAQRLQAHEAFDVLVLGGGPAGAAAAIYAARKGIRTGLLTERLGGQVNDTLAIENFISVLETDGPKLATALEQHIKAYDVEVITRQRVRGLTPAAQNGGWVGVNLESGVMLRARSVIVSTGARWRPIDVPGEQEYKNKGVAYCPHCDGPLFKGKQVAVIGGGNSGVEAAIDLAGLVKQVTLIEYAQSLKADAVLVAKLKSLANVRIVTHAQTLAITGNGQTVHGLQYRDRTTGQTHNLDLEGVFVQIGLLPNTDFLKGQVELTRTGEIVVNERCETNLPGVFAAGDATTTPYKQIIIAAGEGAKAALSAFDHLIRTPVPEQAPSRLSRSEDEIDRAHQA